MKRRNRDVFKRSEVVAMKAAFDVGSYATKPKELWDMLNRQAKDRGAERLFGMNERGFEGVLRIVTSCIAGSKLGKKSHDGCVVWQEFQPCNKSNNG